MSLTRAEAASALGMKETEVVELEKVSGGVVVTTHDGVRTLLANDGSLHTAGEEPDNEAAEDDAGEDDAGEAEPARPRKAAQKRAAR